MAKPASEAIRLAVNYSPAAAELAASGTVEIDLFKCPPWPELFEAARRCRATFVHFDLAVGGGPAGREDLERVESWLERSLTPKVNTHLAPPAGSLPATGTFDEALARAERDLAVLTRRFGAGRVMVENVPWERREGYEIDAVAAEPRLVRRVVEGAGCGLLLDLAHARFAAEERDEEAFAYVEELPVARLTELHVTGLSLDPAGRRRDHMAMTDEDWRLLEWALGEIAARRWRRPWALALEYGGVGEIFEWRCDPGVLRRDLVRLAELLRATGLRP